TTRRPGSSGRTAARQSGLPGLRATPCATMPGRPSLATTRYDTSPAPLDVPPESSTTSHAHARRKALSTFSSSSGTIPSRAGSPPEPGAGAARAGSVGAEAAPGRRRPPGGRPLTPGEKEAAAGPLNNTAPRQPQRRQHAGFTIAEPFAAAQDGFAPADVSA